MMAEVLDLIIIGAGPAGLSVAIEAQKAGLSYLILERGAVANSILHYPLEMSFFSTPPLLEIGGIPFITPNQHPNRIEGLTYYREVTDHFDLKIAFGEEVNGLSSGDRKVVVHSNTGDRTARNVVVATGYFDNPALLNIPGEELPHVSHYYTEGHPYYRKNVVVIGGQNSAVEAALDLLHHKANVTMIVRGKSIGQSVKYWVKPNIENRIKAGAIRAFFETEVISVAKDHVIIRNKDGEQQIECDQLFALTGYHPNVKLLEACGITVDAMSIIPTHNPDTFETNVPNVFIAGSVSCGCETGTVFIENGRLHAYTIIGVIKRRLADAKKTRLIE